MTKKKTHSLTILMLKDTIKEASNAIKEPSGNQCVDVVIDSITGKLYYKQNITYKPSWVKLFEPIIGATLDSLFNSGTSAVLIIPINTKFFALTFGYGRFLLQTDCHEENFGLRVVLNSVDPEKLRSVDAQSLDAVPVNRRTQASVATTIGDFGIDIEQDIVYAATGQPKNAMYGKQVTGKDALKVSIPLAAVDIPPLLENLAAQHNAVTYKESFAWVDHLNEVRTKSKGAATLADKLAAQKEQRDLEGQRDKKRRELFDRQDEIQRKRDGLIDELERQLKQETIISTVLTCEWELT